jgi:excisionase family DNA binding protein
LIVPTLFASFILSTSAPTRRYLSIVEAADYLGVSVKTLRHWRFVGSGPVARKFGRNLRYHVRDLDAWADSRRDGGSG